MSLITEIHKDGNCYLRNFEHPVPAIAVFIRWPGLSPERDVELARQALEVPDKNRHNQEKKA